MAGQRAGRRDRRAAGGGGAVLLWTSTSSCSVRSSGWRSSVDRFAAGDHDGAGRRSAGAEEIRRIAIAQNTMADALARTREDQLRYVATVVHDLRNPLAAVQLAVGYVTPQRPLPSEERIREIFGMIDRQLRRLNSLVGDVLNAVQIEAGEIVLRKTTCDLGELAEEAVSLFQIDVPLPPARPLVHGADHAAGGCDAPRAGAQQSDQQRRQVLAARQPGARRRRRRGRPGVHRRQRRGARASRRRSSARSSARSPAGRASTKRSRGSGSASTSPSGSSKHTEGRSRSRPPTVRERPSRRRCPAG